MSSAIKSSLEPSSGNGVFMSNNDMVNNQNFEQMVERFYVPNGMF